MAVVSSKISKCLGCNEFIFFQVKLKGTEQTERDKVAGKSCKLWSQFGCGKTTVKDSKTSFMFCYVAISMVLFV